MKHHEKPARKPIKRCIRVASRFSVTPVRKKTQFFFHYSNSSSPRRGRLHRSCTRPHHRSDTTATWQAEMDSSALTRFLHFNPKKSTFLRHPCVSLRLIHSYFSYLLGITRIPILLQCCSRPLDMFTQISAFRLYLLAVQCDFSVFTLISMDLGVRQRDFECAK